MKVRKECLKTTGKHFFLNSLIFKEYSFHVPYFSSFHLNFFKGNKYLKERFDSKKPSVGGLFTILKKFTDTRFNCTC